MSKIYFCTGAGISAESGIDTFRSGPNSVWSRVSQDIVELSSFSKNYANVHKFMNERRAELEFKFPNSAHVAIAQLQQQFGTDRVIVLTTNCDNLHEKAGTEVVHLHGELTKIVTNYETEYSETIDIGYAPVNLEDYQSDNIIKPAVTFFGEYSPTYVHMQYMMDGATEDDLIVVIGASNQVIQFNLLASYSKAKSIFVNPDTTYTNGFDEMITATATEGMARLMPRLVEHLSGS